MELDIREQIHYRNKVKQRAINLDYVHSEAEAQAIADNVFWNYMEPHIPESAFYPDLVPLDLSGSKIDQAAIVEIIQSRDKSTGNFSEFANI